MTVRGEEPRIDLQPAPQQEQREYTSGSDHPGGVKPAVPGTHPV
jgi:hypothetical protein